MKRLFAIAFLLVFTFNLGGYYLFFGVLGLKANKELSARLDLGQYDARETIEINIPLPLPYPLQENDYRRQTGRFVYHNEYYQLVMQRYANDTLTIVCIKDAKGKQLADAMTAFAEVTSDKPVKDGSLNIPLKVLLEYIGSNDIEPCSLAGWSRTLNHPFHFECAFQIPLSQESPPPKA